MASGKSSIGVRVRPNANDFIKDLERQLGTKKYTFKVDVKANMQPATNDIREWARTRLKTIPATINVGANMSPATGDVQAWRTKQRGIVTKIPINADMTKAYADLLAFRRFAGGNPIDIELRYNGNTAAATAQFKQFAMAHKSIGTNMDLDIKAAQLKIKQLQGELLSRKLEAKVDIKVSNLDRFQKAVGGIEKKFGNFNFIKSLDAGPVNLGKPGGLVGTLTTVMALAGAVPMATYAITGLSQAMMQLSGAAAIVPGAIAAIAASMATIAVGTSGMSDAFSAMIDLWKETPAEAASSSRRSVQAHNQLRQAVRDEASAQREVGQARRDATSDLRDLNNELRGSVLNEAQAILDLQKARDRMAKGGFDSDTDRLQAALDIKKAEQGIIDVRERNGQLQDKANRAAQDGVEGSDKVQAALERQTRAAESAAMAMEAISSSQATSALGKFQEEVDQLAPNAKDFVMVLFGMRDGFMGLRNEVQQNMFKGTAPAFQKFLNEMMPTIGPGMNRIAQAMNSNILQVFDTLGSKQGKSIIDRVLGGTAKMWESMQRLIDPLVTGFGTLIAAGTEHLPQIVDLFTRLADRFTNFIEQADKDGSLDKFLDNGVDALSKMAELGINLVKIVGNLGGAFKGDFLQMLVDQTDKLNNWITSPEGARKISEWIQQAKDLWQQWKPVLEDLPKTMQAVGDAARTLIDGITPFINLFTETMEHAPGLVEAFVGVWLGSKLISGFLSPVLSMVGGITKAFKYLTSFTPPAWMLKALGAGPNQFGIPPAANPGGVPGAVAATGGAGAGAAVAAAALPTAIVGAGLLYQLTQQIPQDNSLGEADSKKKIEEINGTLPAGIPKYGSKEAAQFIGGLGSQNGPGKWLNDVPVGGGGEARRAARYAWLMTQPNAVDLLESGEKFEPPPGFLEGGWTGNRGRRDGKLAIMHGQEWVQPAPAVDYYGKDVMAAMQKRQIPKSFFGGFWTGGPGDDPRRTLDPNDPSNAPGALPGLMQHLGNGLANVSVPGAGTPGPGNGHVEGTVGAAPGTTPLTTNIFGINVPLGNMNTGWPGGQAPIGLGGGPAGPNGEAPFDMRKFGIGPGPAGSTPSDWGQYVANWGAKTVLSFGQTLLSGALGMFGLEGLMDNPYINAGKGLAGHFAGAWQGSGGDGSGQTATDVNALMNTYDSMGLNPGVGAPDNLASNAAIAGAGGVGSSKGLQINTAKGEQIIRQMFPEIKNIGGVRPDALKWHPSGLALDVMIPGEKGNNDPTTPAGLAEGNKIYAWLNAHKAELGIDYMMWQEKDHYNHIHVNFAPSGFSNGTNPAGGGWPMPGTTTKPAISNGPLGTAPTPGGTTPPGTHIQNGTLVGDPGMSKDDFGAAAAQWYISQGKSVPPAYKQYAPKPNGPIPSSGNPLQDLLNGSLIPRAKMDKGGWMMPGQTLVTNNTGKPELALPMDHIPAFLYGGQYPQGAVPMPVPAPPKPDFTNITPAMPMQPQPAPPIARAPVAAQPPIQAPAEGPPAPGGSAPAVSAITPNENLTRTAPSVMPAQVGPGPGAGASSAGDHVHPALKKGIASGAATLGKLGDMAVAAATMGATGGMGGGMAGGGGGGGGGMGGGGLSISGMAAQAGKIITNVANVASSFLVGNITNGTTENPYGVTQRGSNPTGGTRITDNSTKYGDVYTQDQDAWFRKLDLREAQKSQANLGGYDRYA